ncbi:bcl-2-binding component 3 [Anas platyrhynchos]|uniref:bcl-2-binding component 3 n=1 Tax=Anas platyrhynchos TaxID=8839 RepID=UPI003AF22078
MARALRDGSSSSEPAAALRDPRACRGGGAPPRVSPPPPGPPLSCAPPPIAFSPHPWAAAGTPGVDGAPPAAVGAGGPTPGLEQELGARLRRLGDAFQRAYELQPPQRREGSFWGHVYRLVSQLLGAVYNLQAAALPPRHHD